MKAPNGRLSAGGSAQARRHGGGHSGADIPKSFLCLPKFAVLKKICFTHMIKIKIFAP